MGSSGVSKALDIFTGGATAAYRSTKDGSSPGGILGSVAKSTFGAPAVANEGAKASPTPAGPDEPRTNLMTPEQRAAKAEADKKAKADSDLLAAQTSEARALRTSLSNVQAGIGRSGYGGEGNLTDPLGLTPDVVPRNKRLLGL